MKTFFINGVFSIIENKYFMKFMLRSKHKFLMDIYSVKEKKNSFNKFTIMFYNF